MHSLIRIWRRTLLHQGLPEAAPAQAHTWRMPDEGTAQVATWMAFGLSEELWGKRLLPVARHNLAEIAKAIATHEPVKMLVRKEDHDIATRLCGSSVDLIVQPIDDLWMRDTGPVFVMDQSGQLGAVGFNFNGWGGKQEHEHAVTKRHLEILRQACDADGRKLKVRCCKVHRPCVANTRTRSSRPAISISTSATAPSLLPNSATRKLMVMPVTYCGICFRTGRSFS